MINNLSKYVCVCSNLSEESKQQSSELSEQLKLSTQENGAMRLEVEELRKRLEMADLMLQQVCKTTSITFYARHVKTHLSCTNNRKR